MSLSVPAATADAIPEDPPGRGATAFLPISNPPAAAEIEAALTAFFAMRGGSWERFLEIAPVPMPDQVRANMAAALTAAGEACAGRR